VFCGLLRVVISLFLIAESTSGVHLISAKLTAQALFGSGRRLELPRFARVARRLSFLELVLARLAVVALAPFSILSRLAATFWMDSAHVRGRSTFELFF
jgi:hypothetical protein